MLAGHLNSALNFQPASRGQERAGSQRYLQRLHGQVGGVVVVDFAGVPGGLLVQVVRRLQAREEKSRV